ncbi:hypothetical protein BH10BAC3_BH10BAC3_16630 [soil metagenome]
MLKEEALSRLDILRTEYIKLLNDKDVLLNWGKPQLEALYATRIGVYLLEQLQLQLRIKALKRKLEIVRSKIVRNLPLDVVAIELLIAEELAEAEIQIMQQTLEIEKGKHLLTHLDTPQRSAELRKIFKQLAKQLHPDVNPNLTPEQVKLWHLAKDAYESGDVEKLKALQVAYEKELLAADAQLETLSEADIALRNEVLAEGIKLLNVEIESIRLEFPFDMEQQIKDEDWVACQVKDIQANMKQLRRLEGELILEYEALIHGYGGTNPELN